MVSEHSSHGMLEKLSPTVPFETCANVKLTIMFSLGSTLHMVGKPLKLVIVDLCSPFQEITLNRGGTLLKNARQAFDVHEDINHCQ